MKETLGFIAAGTILSTIAMVTNDAWRDHSDQETVDRFNVPCDSKNSLVVPFRGMELTRADSLSKSSPDREKVPAGTTLCVLEQSGTDIAQIKIKDKAGTVYVASIKAK